MHKMFSYVVCMYFIHLVSTFYHVVPCHRSSDCGVHAVIATLLQRCADSSCVRIWSKGHPSRLNRGSSTYDSTTGEWSGLGPASPILCVVYWQVMK